MRHLVIGSLAALLLAAPCIAQTAPAPKPDKDQKASAPAAAPAKKDDGKTETAPDPSIANYDVNGSNATDAMGTP